MHLIGGGPHPSIWDQVEVFDEIITELINIDPRGAIRMVKKVEVRSIGVERSVGNVLLPHTQTHAWNPMRSLYVYQERLPSGSFASLR